MRQGGGPKTKATYFLYSPTLRVGAWAVVPTVGEEGLMPVIAASPLGSTRDRTLSYALLLTGRLAFRRQGEDL